MDTSLLGALDDADRRAGIGLAVVAGARKHSQASFGWHVPAFQGQSDIRNAGHIVGSIKSVLSSDAIPVIFFSCDRFKSKSLPFAAAEPSLPPRGSHWPLRNQDASWAFTAERGPRQLQRFQREIILEVKGSCEKLANAVST
ncbi:predicted protein [Histoplasma capsulatum G186AR]|uniref:Uncharacterized protein n=1 Tax=Ajellomyces capsulatus (strain G186AR / H82 / ATCC MYA-2454 / RMSCC 2432) TaxID=447093 RepID=C0NB58_AJECG|nr:uncharacterized protein HCBG_00354 [Histoplasma capsulatum G186AR]EEH10899.1 predicted protein [Histoplasma capsulatum G186AR]